MVQDTIDFLKRMFPKNRTDGISKLIHVMIDLNEKDELDDDTFNVIIEILESYNYLP